MIKPNPLKAFLVSVGMSQGQLADKTGISRSKINLFLNGRLNLEKKELLLIQEALGLGPIDSVNEEYLKFMTAISKIKG